MLLKAYFLTYNLVSAGGWAYVWLLLVQNIDGFFDQSKNELWDRIAGPIIFVQSLAVLEVVNSLLRLTRSPLYQAFVQIGSRLMVLYGFTVASATAQKHWSLYLMVLAWCHAEVPRYVFYAWKIVGNKVHSLSFGSGTLNFTSCTRSESRANSCSCG